MELQDGFSERKLRRDRSTTLRISMALLSQVLPDPHVKLTKEVNDTDSKDSGMMKTGRTC